MKEHLGTHYILEACECNPKLIDDKNYIMDSLRESIKLSNATLMEDIAIEFTPQGVTAVCLLSESHLSIHTWPEKNYAAIDIFTCGEHCSPLKACNYLIDAFHSRKPSIKIIQRGIVLDRAEELIYN